MGVQTGKVFGDKIIKWCFWKRFAFKFTGCTNKESFWMVASVRMGTFQVSLEISESAAAAMPTRGIVTSKGHQSY